MMTGNQLEVGYSLKEFLKKFRPSYYQIVIWTLVDSTPEFGPTLETDFRWHAAFRIIHHVSNSIKMEQNTPNHEPGSLGDEPLDLDGNFYGV